MNDKETKFNRNKIRVTQEIICDQNRIDEKKRALKTKAEKKSKEVESTMGGKETKEKGKNRKVV